MSKRATIEFTEEDLLQLEREDMHAREFLKEELKRMEFCFDLVGKKRIDYKAAEMIYDFYKQKVK
jgi:hypothetical protein